MGTFDDNRRHHAERTDAFRRVAFRLHPPEGDIGFHREVERVPFVPSDDYRVTIGLDLHAASEAEVHFALPESSPDTGRRFVLRVSKAGGAIKDEYTRLNQAILARLE